jgi:putative transcriptional regulator
MSEIAHHPGEELLLSYASGAADEAVSLVVATHMALCPQCRLTVAAAEAAGGAMLSHIPPVSLNERAYQSVLSRLDAPSAEILRSARLNSNVPAPLQPYIGTDFDRVPWRHIFDGLSTYPLPTKGRTRARLIRAMPGAEVATHTHRGEEWTLVLTGSFADVTGRYAVGDLQSTTPDVKHKPTAEVGPACINLAVTDAPLIFEGFLPKIVGKIFGF